MSKATRWDSYFLSKADVSASQSKDPSTKIGAVIADKYDRDVSSGYNGPPRGIKDSSKILDNREIKYEVVIHAEANAILFAERNLHGCKLYSTHIPCSRCASMIIQVGIKEVVAGVEYDSGFNDRWSDSHTLTRKLFKEAGVKLREIPR